VFIGILKNGIENRTFCGSEKVRYGQNKELAVHLGVTSTQST
jgi:hypothetical protein